MLLYLPVQYTTTNLISQKLLGGVKMQFPCRSLQEFELSTRASKPKK